MNRTIVGLTITALATTTLLGCTKTEEGATWAQESVHSPAKLSVVTPKARSSVQVLAHLLVAQLVIAKSKRHSDKHSKDKQMVQRFVERPFMKQSMQMEMSSKQVRQQRLAKQVMAILG